MIHKTNIISETAKIGKNVNIGAYNVIEDNVIIGNNVNIGNFNTISEFTEIGDHSKIINGNSIGAIPQDKKFEGEETKLVIGERTIIREFVTLNRGTKDSGETKIGDDVLTDSGIFGRVVNIKDDRVTLVVKKGEIEILKNNISFK